MDEYIEVSFRQPTSTGPGGIELDEPDPIERTVSVQLAPRGEATRQRMKRIAQVKGWQPGEFRLNISVEDGSLMLRGVDADALPEGLYAITVEIEEADCTPKKVNVEVRQDTGVTATFTVVQDRRSVELKLTNGDQGVLDVIDASRVDGLGGREWLDADKRPVRKACLLNLLGSLRARPLVSNSLIQHVHHTFAVFNDRAFMRVDNELLPRMQELVKDRGCVLGGAFHVRVSGGGAVALFARQDVEWWNRRITRRAARCHDFILGVDADQAPQPQIAGEHGVTLAESGVDERDAGRLMFGVHNFNGIGEAGGGFAPEAHAVLAHGVLRGRRGGVPGRREQAFVLQEHWDAKWLALVAQDWVITGHDNARGWRGEHLQCLFEQLAHAVEAVFANQVGEQVTCSMTVGEPTGTLPSTRCRFTVSPAPITAPECARRCSIRLGSFFRISVARITCILCARVNPWPQCTESPTTTRSPITG